MAYIDSFLKKMYQISDNPIHFNLNLENHLASDWKFKFITFDL